jgi:hypothetical protein
MPYDDGLAQGKVNGWIVDQTYEGNGSGAESGSGVVSGSDDGVIVNVGAENESVVGASENGGEVIVIVSRRTWDGTRPVESAVAGTWRPSISQTPHPSSLLEDGIHDE